MKRLRYKAESWEEDETGTSVYRYELSDADQSVKTVLSLPQGYLDADGWHFYLRDCQGNVRSIVRANGAVEEFYHYYPYGELTAESSYSTITSRRYGDKESSTYTGTTISDHGARPYLAAMPGFSTQDPLGHTTPAVTPYLYCGADPINRSDPTGLNYLVTIDMENSIITISATYHSFTKDCKLLAGGLDFWNKLSGKEMNGYVINFDLSMETHAGDYKKLPKNWLGQFVQFDDSYSSNTFIEDSRRTLNSGDTKHGNEVVVNEFLSTKYTVPHEIGHTLGLIHSDFGLMTKSDNEYRSSKVSRDEIRSMIYSALSGEVNSENGDTAGKGQLLFLNCENAQIAIDELKKLFSN